MENVIPLPAKLERLSKRIKKNMEVGHKIRAEWIASKIEMGLDLLEARREFGKNDRAFHDWLTAEGLGDSTLPKDDRAALIAMAADPDRMRVVFQTTTRWSPQHIFRSEWDVSSRDERSTKKRKGSHPPVKTNEARDFVRAKMDAGEHVTRGSNVSPTLRRAVEYEEGRRDGLAEAEARGATYTKAQTHHVEMRIKAEAKRLAAELAEERAKLHAEIKAEVDRHAQATIGFYNGQYEKLKEERETCRKIINNHKPPFTIAEYVDILFCTHNEHVDEERRKRAGIAMISKKLQLTGKK